MEISKTKGKLTVKIIADKVGFAYMDKANNIVTDLDEYRLNRNLMLLKGRKGVFVEHYKALTEKQVKAIQRENDREIDYLIKRDGLAKSGGIKAMLINKGFR